MSESHSKGEQRHQPLTLASTDSRTTMTRASDGRPFKPYVYRGGEEEPPAVIAARRRHQALSAGIERKSALIVPDPAPGCEWHRELKGDDELAELAAERDRYQAAMAAVPEPPPEPVAAAPAPASRCRRCRYLTTSAGHRVMCDG